MKQSCLQKVSKFCHKKFLPSAILEIENIAYFYEQVQKKFKEPLRIMFGGRHDTQPDDTQPNDTHRIVLNCGAQVITY